MDNAVTITGNTTRDAELRFTNSGTATASFGVAINTRRKGASGEWEDGDPQFYDVKCFGTLAENVAECIERGTRVVISGKLDFSSWEKDGQKRSKIEILADAIGPDLRWATCKVERSDNR